MRLKFAKDKYGKLWRLIQVKNRIRVDIVPLDKAMPEMTAEQLVECIE